MSALYKQDGARWFLWSQGVALKDFAPWVKATTERVAENARKIAPDAGRPIISLDQVKTHNRTRRKDERATSVAERDGVTEGVVCLISAVESCFSFAVRTRHDTGRLELVRRERKCLHHDLSLIDAEFGFMHVRIQGWIPYECQIYINGRAALDALCRPRTNRGRRHARFNPLNDGDLALFHAVLAAEHAIHGFGNTDITKRLSRDHQLIPTNERGAANAPHASWSSSEDIASSPKFHAPADTASPATATAS